MKTVQELLRHANSSVTMNLYAQAVTDIKRSAQSKVARLVFKSEKARKSENPAYWTGGKPWGFQLSLLFCWRPRRDLNPCYRRERAVS